ncbi:hypothetical protein AMK30_12450 [Streptomyces sp. CB02460]|nr:hypothetical protein AMK30_12450 [Streptomyces sp. CB02460]
MTPFTGLSPRQFGKLVLHVRLRLRRDAIDLLGNALRDTAETVAEPDERDDPPLCSAPVR